MNTTENVAVQKTTKPSFNIEEVLTAPELARFYEESNRTEFGKRDTIIKQGSKVTEVALVISGLVKVTREMRKGKNLILRVAQPGCFVGISSGLASETYEYSVCSMETTTIRTISVDTLRWLMESNHRFANEINQRICAENLFNISRLSSLLSKQLPGRVADIILYFSQDIFSSNEFSIPLTRQELAELAGTTKESLIRTLSEFKNDKIIDMNRNVFSINSFNILKTLSRLG